MHRFSSLRSIPLGTVALALFALLAAVLVAVPNARGAEIAEGYYGSNKERAEGSIPSLGGKIIGYSQYVDKNGFPPQNLILGTSRGMMLDPRVVKRVSGRTAFNSSVSDGAARELYAMGNFSELIAPGRAPHLVIMFDIEGLDRRAATQRVLATMKSERAIRTACPKAAKCTTFWRTKALEIVRDATIGHEGRPDLKLLQRPDGMILSPHLARLHRVGQDFVALRNHRIQIRVNSYRPGGGFDKLMPIPMAATRDLIKLANGWGDTPTIIITPMHPDCIRICGAAGRNAHHRNALTFFAQLAKTRQFDLHDFTDPKSYGGNAAGFYEDIHLRPVAAAQVVQAIDKFGGWDVDPRKPTTVDTAASVKSALASDTVSSDADAGELAALPDADPADLDKARLEQAASRTKTTAVAALGSVGPTFLERGLNQLGALARG
ncbi:MAG: hypothetical protein H7287_10915 [Thermoleophilia bacterium]|nr:hypothetical protein [Thermoleophilia bacterium]